MVSFRSGMLAAITAFSLLGSIQAAPIACNGVSPWQTGVAYVGGNQVVYHYHLWTAKWWSYNDIPGGAAGVWVDDGPCTY